MTSVWLTVGQIAERDGVDKSSVSRRVKGFVADHGLEVTRDPRGRVETVNVVQYDLLRAQTADPAKSQASHGMLAPDIADLVRGGSYDDHAREQKKWQARQARLQVERDEGLLVPTDEVAEGYALARDAATAVIDRLPNYTEDMANAVTKGGHHELRAYLRRTVVPAIRAAIAAAMQDAAARLPERKARDEAGAS